GRCNTKVPTAESTTTKIRRMIPVLTEASVRQSFWPLRRSLCAIDIPLPEDKRHASSHSRELRQFAVAVAFSRSWSFATQHCFGPYHTAIAGVCADLRGPISVRAKEGNVLCVTVAGDLNPTRRYLGV